MSGNVIPFPAPEHERREFKIASATYVIDPDAGTQQLRIDARIVDGLDRDQIIRRTFNVRDPQDREELTALLRALGVKLDEDGNVRASLLRDLKFSAALENNCWIDPQPPKRTTLRHVIVIRQDLVGVVDEAERALQADERLFTRAGTLVRVLSPGEKIPDVLKRVRFAPPEGAPTIDIVTRDHLRERIANAAWWVRATMDEKTGKEKLIDALPPDWVAKTLHARGEWSLRPLDRIVETPTLRPDGTVITVPGYDAVTGILYAPLTEYPHMPDAPTKNDALKALEQLKELIVNFPFVDESDRSTSIARMLTIAGRSGIPGPVPMFVDRAPTPGTGKGKHAEASTIAMTGRPPTLMMPIASDNDDEWRKSLLSLALAGYPVVSIDNVKGTLGSPSLAAALTTGSITGRILGVSRTVTVPFSAVMIAAGNNLGFSDDLGRRVMPSDLDARTEHPEERTDFVHADLIRHATEHHPTYVTAALTILRAYCCAGRPSEKRPKYGSYERWDDLVRGAILWLGLADPLEGRQRIKAESDVDALTISEVLHAWRGVFASTSQTVAEAVNASTIDPKTRESKQPTLRAALELACGGKDPSAYRIGLRFRSWRGRIVGGLRLETNGEAHGGVARWRVVEVTP